MKRSPQSMTRVFWHMGQALLPEHFYAQETSLRSETALRFEMSGAPSWGLGKFEWDKYLLPQGRLEVRELSVVLESGTIIDIPGNAAPISLDLPKSGRSRTPIYLQLQSDFEIVESKPGSATEEGIRRILQKVELTTEQTTADERFELAHVERGANDVWSFSAEYIPPLLNVRHGLLFDKPLERMDHLVKALRHLLKQELQENHLSGETQLLAKQALRTMFQLHAALVDIGGQITPHPHSLFVALRNLYIDTCVLRDAPLDAIDLAYDHTELAAGFDALLSPLEAITSRGRPEVPYIEFVRREGQLCCDIDKNIKRAKDVFLLLQKPQVSSKIDLGKVKFSSPTRLNAVYERALTGIPVTRIERPPFAQTLSSTVDIYAVSRGQEWDYAVGEGHIVLFDVPQLEGCRLYLYCRTE
jgi:type VI secretion system protein ImpJ